MQIPGLKIIDYTAPTQGGHTTVSSTSYLDLSYVNLNLSAGEQPEYAHITLSCLMTHTTGVITAKLRVDGVLQNPEIYHSSQSWERLTETYIVPIPANTTVALGISVVVNTASGQFGATGTHAAKLVGFQAPAMKVIT